MAELKALQTEIINFWTNEETMQKWFIQDPNFDEEIRSRYGVLAARARSADLDAWTSSPEGTLALIILLDQFSRNLYRGSAESYAADAKALSISVKAIAKGFDLQLPLKQQIILYLPLVHDESLISQVAARALYEGFARRCGESGEEGLEGFAKAALESCNKHLAVIQRFGRYPARNKALGRESTEEEMTFLKDTPGGF